jgi:hypothetical protein
MNTSPALPANGDDRLLVSVFSAYIMRLTFADIWTPSAGTHQRYILGLGEPGAVRPRLPGRRPQLADGFVQWNCQ